MGALESKLIGEGTDCDDPFAPLRQGGGDMAPWALCIFEYCDWKTRKNVMMLSKGWWRNSNLPAFYRFLGQCLSREHGVYVPPVPPAGYSWKLLFFELYKLRDLWSDTDFETVTDTTGRYSKPVSTVAERFKVSVFARFRPHQPSVSQAPSTLKRNKKIQQTAPKFIDARAEVTALTNKTGVGGWEGSKDVSSSAVAVNDENINVVSGAAGTTTTSAVAVAARATATPISENEDDREPEAEKIEVVLPLHQRLAMIKLSRKLTSNREALKVLTSEGGWFESKWSSLGSSSQPVPTQQQRQQQQVSPNQTQTKTDSFENTNNGEAQRQKGSGSQSMTPVMLLETQTRGGASFEADQYVPAFVRRLCNNSNPYPEEGSTAGTDGKSAGGEACSIKEGFLRAQRRLRDGEVGETTGGTSSFSSSSSMTASLQSIDAMNGRVVLVAPDVGLREFCFDSVLPLRASQRALYDTAARRLVMDFINGFNSTAIVYGQTGAGKTYTMFGRDSEAVYGADAEGKGIVPRACEEIFNALHARHGAQGALETQQGTPPEGNPTAPHAKGQSQQGQQQGFVIDSEVFVSYVEIFGDHVSDLLRYGERCGQSKVASQRYVLQGAAERRVESMADVIALLRQGEEQKRRAATAMNDRSTRAHSLFIVTLKQTRVCSSGSSKRDNSSSSGTGDGDDRAGRDTAQPEQMQCTGNKTLTSRLFLADLGGSEQVKKSKVDAGVTRMGAGEEFSLGFQMGDRMREAVYINLGLLALKKCIEALNLRSPYVPYQDSKLTQLLSEGLGGNCKTSVIVCANADPTHMTETVATMRFGERCASVETSARNNATMLASVLQELDADIAALEAQIAAKERWELRNEERADELAEEGTLEQAMGGVEVKRVYVLVGAETERRQLEELLDRRAKFVGSDSISLSSDGLDDAGLKGPTAHTGKRVVGFGKEYAELYGLGGRFDEEAEFTAENSRFAEKVADASEVPTAVRALTERRGKTMGWAVGDKIIDEDAAALERKAQKAKRNRLAYSGISA